ncbi:MarR family winged helix-turn-helix transcriptional regulator [Desulfitobacterium chlororespirans]|uniref:DNA-binding transcriptional regulator, MarR family n=1 Tax=Desulfitobacterium chlororespirans DSM 11544 TaxID=1121395 RepID=A0A1M7S5C9_9FIRM|nr:MarR family transcriptional regulator [Desulfitobacterium chlororespirans]SHN53535.1 DNA-binding transcriptional regulator, MarR family [Desulfitobacterium chlororespirans DSM 11544]
METKNFDLIMQLTRVEWLLHRYHQQNHMNFGPMGDPRRGQGRVLAILKMQPEISQKELSYLLDMRPQSLGELLSKLEKNEYITRTPSESDRRVMNVRLTKKGIEATESAEEFSFDHLFGCLSGEEQKSLSGYLDRIIATLEAELGDEQLAADFDPRLHRGNPFDDHLGGHPHWGSDRDYPDDRRFGPRSGMSRGHGGRPAPSLDKQDEE